MEDSPCSLTTFPSRRDWNLRPHQELSVPVGLRTHSVSAHKRWKRIKLDLYGNTVLITGGSTGIGFALAERYVDAGSEVIVCGRRKSKLGAAKHKLPALHTLQCDVSLEPERKKLLRWTGARFPSLNMLINNAGIQRSIDYRSPRGGEVSILQR